MNVGGTPGALKMFGAAEQMENWTELLDIISPCYHHRHWKDQRSCFNTKVKIYQRMNTEEQDDNALITQSLF